VNWDKKSWEFEDIKYAPKRKVQNKISWRKPHLIGSFYSHKMKVVVEYESLNEYIFYCLLELDKKTIKYYVQQVKIIINTINDKGIIKT
jgi:hypothetical protein